MIVKEQFDTTLYNAFKIIIFKIIFLKKIISALENDDELSPSTYQFISSNVVFKTVYNLKLIDK